LTKVVTWPAHAGAGRVAALGHETIQDAVEGDAVEETVARQETTKLLTAMGLYPRRAG